MALRVIAELRDHRFASLSELKATITERLAAYNAEPFQKRARSRASVFVTEEQPLLRRLPAAAYEISRWVYGRPVARNGHVAWGKNHYSVPFARIGAKSDLRITDRTLEAQRYQEPENARGGTTHRLPACREP